MKVSSTTTPNGKNPTSVPDVSTMSQNPSAKFNGSVGKVAAAILPGITEVSVNCPWVTAKNMMQNGTELPKPVWKNIHKYYRGYPTLALGYVPYKAVMLGVNDALLSAASKGRGPLFSGANSESTQPREITARDRFAAGGMAGGIAAFIACPVEQVMIQQQLTPGATFKSSIKDLSAGGLKSHYRGIGPCIGRETVYASSLLGLSQSIKNSLPESIKEHETASTLLSGVSAGAVAAALTQPLDTIKTVQQASDPKSAGPTFKEAAANITADGWKELWRGTVPRSARIGLGAGIILGVRDAVEKVVKES